MTTNTHKRTAWTDCTGAEYKPGQYVYTCECCAKPTFLADETEVYGHICNNCWWEAGVDEPEDLPEARRNYYTYGAFGPVGYRCKTGYELPVGVGDDAAITAVFLLVTTCPVCDSRMPYPHTGGTEECPKGCDIDGYLADADDADEPH